MARVLVVEDNPQNLKLASVLLRSRGHEVVPATSAEEAERLIDLAPVDLILMDLGLPGKDGYTLTRELRGRPETAQVPILAVTSFAMKGDEERAMAAGCSAYLTKPIRAAAFLRQVDGLLRPGVRPSPEAVGSSAAARFLPARPARAATRTRK
jgi:two-component system, cell cycle response regulator DivK